MHICLNLVLQMVNNVFHNFYCLKIIFQIMRPIMNDFAEVETCVEVRMYFITKYLVIRGLNR